MKKGMFFTLMAISLVSFLVVTFSITAQYRYYNKMRLIETRAGLMNSFIDSLEKDMSRALYISGFRAIVSIDNYIVTNGTFISDLDATFDEVILNGTINGQQQILMINQTLTAWKNKIINKSRDSGLFVDINIFDIKVEQISPWVMKFSAVMNFTLTDKYNTASWNMSNVEISSLLEVYGFEDPLYALNTNNKISRRIEATNITNWDNATLLSHLTSHTYDANPNAPSFLMRLTNNMSPSPYGIESLVDTNELIIYGIGVKNSTSSVDYLYWDGGGVNNSYIHGISDNGHPYFMLDSEHAAFYNVTNCTY